MATMPLLPGTRCSIQHSVAFRSCDARVSLGTAWSAAATENGDMPGSLNPPLILVVCPQCHARQRVRSGERYDPVCYLCPKCLHVWDTTTVTALAAQIELTIIPHQFRGGSDGRGNG
jgi:hypothetical protein